MSVTLIAAMPCQPTIVTTPSGHSYIKEWDVLALNCDEAWDEDDNEVEDWVPNYIDWNNHNAYRVLVSIGVVPEGGNIHNLDFIRCDEILVRCNMFLDANGVDNAWAEEFSLLECPIMQCISETIGEGANVVNLADMSADGLVDRVEQLQRYCVDAIVQLGQDAHLQIY